MKRQSRANRDDPYGAEDTLRFCTVDGRRVELCGPLAARDLAWFYSADSDSEQGVRAQPMPEPRGDGGPDCSGMTDRQRGAARKDRRILAITRSIGSTYAGLLANCYKDLGGSAPTVQERHEYGRAAWAIRATDGRTEAETFGMVRAAFAAYEEACRHYAAQRRDEERCRRGVRARMLATVRALAAPVRDDVQDVANRVKALIAPFLGKRQGCRDDVDG